MATSTPSESSHLLREFLSFNQEEALRKTGYEGDTAVLQVILLIVRYRGYASMLATSEMKDHGYILTRGHPATVGQYLDIFCRPGTTIGRAYPYSVVVKAKAVYDAKRAGTGNGAGVPEYAATAAAKAPEATGTLGELLAKKIAGDRAEKISRLLKGTYVPGQWVGHLLECMNRTNALEYRNCAATPGMKDVVASYRSNLSISTYGNFEDWVRYLSPITHWAELHKEVSDALARRMELNQSRRSAVIQVPAPDEDLKTRVLRVCESRKWGRALVTDMLIRMMAAPSFSYREEKVASNYQYCVDNYPKSQKISTLWDFELWLSDCPVEEWKTLYQEVLQETIERIYGKPFVDTNLIVAPSATLTKPQPAPVRRVRLQAVGKFQKEPTMAETTPEIKDPAAFANFISALAESNANGEASHAMLAEMKKELETATMEKVKGRLHAMYSLTEDAVGQLRQASQAEKRARKVKDDINALSAQVAAGKAPQVLLEYLDGFVNGRRSYIDVQTAISYGKAKDE